MKVKCLRCGRKFITSQPRRNRLCDSCRRWVNKMDFEFSGGIVGVTESGLHDCNLQVDRFNIRI